MQRWLHGPDCRESFHHNKPESDPTSNGPTPTADPHCSVISKLVAVLALTQTDLSIFNDTCCSLCFRWCIVINSSSTGHSLCIHVLLCLVYMQIFLPGSDTETHFYVRQAVPTWLTTTLSVWITMGSLYMFVKTLICSETIHLSSKWINTEFIWCLNVVPNCIRGLSFAFISIVASFTSKQPGSVTCSGHSLVTCCRVRWQCLALRFGLNRFRSFLTFLL